MAFIVSKKLDLGFLGEGWQGAYINFSLPSLKEGLDQNTPSEEEIKADPKKHTQVMVEFAEKHFLDGQGWNGSQLVSLVAADIQELPTTVFVEATKLLMGAPDPKS